MSFRGTFEHTIDAKGRVSLPARHREILAGTGADKLVVTRDFENNLMAYAPAEWAEFEAKFDAVSSMDPKVKAAQRFLVGSAQELPVDGSGRILIPPFLRTYAGLERDVVFVGMRNKIEIWASERYAEKERELTQAEMQEALAGLGL